MKFNPNGKTVFFGTGYLVLLSLSVWFYIGFYYPDPYALDRYHPLSTALLWMIRVLFPFLAIGFLALLYRIQTRKTSWQSAGLLVITLIVLGFLFYPMANHFYLASMSVKNRTAEYHPYLQLTPHLYQPARGDTLNIVCLGGSTTEFPDEQGHGWPDRLEKILNEQQEGRPVRVHNLGRQWYTSLHSLINYETNVHPYKPDIILVMHAVNDLLNNADFSYFSHQAFRNDYGHFYGPVNRIVVSQELMGFMKEFIGYLWYYRPRSIIDTDFFPGLVPYKQNLTHLIQLASANGTQVVLMTQPSLYQPRIAIPVQKVLYMLNNEAIGPDKKWSYCTAFRGMNQYNQTARDLARDFELPLVELEKAIPKTLDYFYDDVHYRTQTYDIIAETIAQKLLEKEKLSP